MLPVARGARAFLVGMPRGNVRLKIERASSSVGERTGHPIAKPVPPTRTGKQLVSTPMLSDYWHLSKGHLSLWVSLSALPGYFASGVIAGPAVLPALLVGTFLSSASSQALNQMIESDRDATMDRTKNRPVPTGRISKEKAKIFGFSSAIAGSAILTIGTGSIAPACIALSTIGIYVGIYTPMKQKSAYNTHVGAIAGSLPVIMGYAATGGFPVLVSTPDPAVLLAIQTLWQFPHFYPLAWIYRADYCKGGYVMFPLSDVSGHATARMCGPYMAALAVLPFVSSGLGVTTWMFPVSASIANLIWTKQWFDFYSKPSKKNAKLFFFGSLWYLLTVLGLFVLHNRTAAESRGSVQDRIRTYMSSICLHKSVAINDQFCPIPRDAGPARGTNPDEKDRSSSSPS